MFIYLIIINIIGFILCYLRKYKVLNIISILGGSLGIIIGIFNIIPILLGSIGGYEAIIKPIANKITDTKEEWFFMEEKIVLTEEQEKEFSNNKGDDTDE